MKKMTSLAIVVACGLLSVSSTAQAGVSQTDLMVDGESCDAHFKELTDALTAVKGVTRVDLKSKKGHVIVSHDGTVKTATLIAIIQTVKGSEARTPWYCIAMVME
ncbi:MAG TPA: hypothetical protein VLY45_03945 [Nitrospiria bacterium]|nr:hypothetical protein [Nitrospiria bacterium]